MNRLSEITAEQKEAVCAAYAVKLLNTQDYSPVFDEILNLLIDALMLIDDEQLADDIKKYVGLTGSKEIWAKAEEWLGPF